MSAPEFTDPEMQEVQEAPEMAQTSESSSHAVQIAGVVISGLGLLYSFVKGLRGSKQPVRAPIKPPDDDVQARLAAHEQKLQKLDMLEGVVLHLAEESIQRHLSGEKPSPHCVPPASADSH